MKKILFLMFSLVSVIGLTALAQTASPTPSPVPAPSTGEVLLGLFGLVKSWGSIGMYAGVAAALKLLVDGLKAIGWWDKIPSQWQSSVVLLVACVTVGLTSLAAGATMPMAVAAVLGSSSAAMLFHELTDDLLLAAKKAFEKKTPPPV